MTGVLPNTIRLVEVGPRDGLQFEQQYVEPSGRAQLIQLLCEAGLRWIEGGAFYSQKKVTPMEYTEQVLQLLPQRLQEQARLFFLTPTAADFQQAQRLGIKRVAVLSSASPQMLWETCKITSEQNWMHLKQWVPQAVSQGIWVRGYVGCAWGCPFTGKVSDSAVVSTVGHLSALGCQEIVLADTLGGATPWQVRSLLTLLQSDIPMDRLAVHFHDTHGQAMANVWESLNLGVCTIDAAIAGIGGTPYAQKNQAGNVATEQVLHLLQGAGIETGVDMDALQRAAAFIRLALGRPGV